MTYTTEGLLDIGWQIHFEDDAYWAENHIARGCFATANTMPDLIDCMTDALSTYFEGSRHVQDVTLNELGVSFDEFLIWWAGDQRSAPFSVTGAALHDALRAVVDAMQTPNVHDSEQVSQIVNMCSEIGTGGNG